MKTNMRKIRFIKREALRMKGKGEREGRRKGKRRDKEDILTDLPTASSPTNSNFLISQLAAFVAIVSRYFLIFAHFAERISTGMVWSGFLSTSTFLTCLSSTGNA